tara:strand:- start:2874 stop:2996 length:123 start_codon:yes stop_codon:yes gene_type:complete
LRPPFLFAGLVDSEEGRPENKRVQRAYLSFASAIEGDLAV